MAANRDRFVMFHGTSSAFLPEILGAGLSPTPPARLSTLMLTNADGHTTSFDGVYVTTMPDNASSYAKTAAERFGGEPVIVTVVVPLAALVPDEDEILYHLNFPLAESFGWEASSDEGFAPTRPWSRECALDAVNWVLREGSCRGYPKEVLEAAADALDVMVTATMAQSKRDPAWLFDPHASDDEGWSSPRWVRSLTSTPEGMATYRAGMDRMSKAFAGADPGDYPCGTEGCKGRILTAVGPSTAGAFVAGVGAPDDMFSHFDARESLVGVAIAPEAREHLADFGDPQRDAFYGMTG